MDTPAPPGSAQLTWNLKESILPATCLKKASQYATYGILPTSRGPRFKCLLTVWERAAGWDLADALVAEKSHFCHHHNH